MRHIKIYIIEELIETKYSDENISKSLLYYAERLNPTKATQIVAKIRRPYDKGRIKVTDPISYFRKNIYSKRIWHRIILSESDNFFIFF